MVLSLFNVVFVIFMENRAALLPGRRLCRRGAGGKPEKRAIFADYLKYDIT